MKSTFYLSLWIFCTLYTVTAFPQYEDNDVPVQLAPASFSFGAERNLAAVNIAGAKEKAKSMNEQSAPSTVSIGHSSFTDDSKIEILAEFEFGDNKRKVRSTRTVFVESGFRDWFGLSKPSDGVVWLGRIVQNSNSALEVEYMVVDMQKDDVVLSIPKMKAPYDQKIIIQSDRANERLSFSFSAKQIARK